MSLWLPMAHWGQLSCSELIPEKIFNPKGEKSTCKSSSLIVEVMKYKHTSIVLKVKQSTLFHPLKR